ncbi:MAG: hypothetical protein KAQ65_11755 [Candidatus Thorarchaeota archaeon]|nr:hypothetical protein [Candidatus Thorarchaeota archaeon]
MFEEDNPDQPEVEDTPPAEITEREEKQKEVRPRKRKRSRSKFYEYGTMAAFISWVGFLVVWLFFFAGSYTIFENIGVAIASFFIVGGILAIAFIPSSAGPTGSAWPIKLSIISGIAWIVFMVIWLPFYAVFYTIYQNVVFIIVASLLVFLMNIFIWGGTLRKEIGLRPTYTMFIFGLWLAFLVAWLWFFALGFTGYQNIAITMISFQIGMLFVYLLWRSEIDRGKGELKGGGLFVVWFILLAAWFWFLADSFDVYQNLAIIILSMFVFMGIGYFFGRNRWGSISDLDWDE